MSDMAKKSINVVVDKVKCNTGKCGCGGCGYFLGVIGSAVYYVSQTSGFWNVVVALLKALVWPAFLVYEALKFFSA